MGGDALQCAVETGGQKQFIGAIGLLPVARAVSGDGTSVEGIRSINGGQRDVIECFCDFRNRGIRKRFFDAPAEKRSPLTSRRFKTVGGVEEQLPQFRCFRDGPVLVLVR